MLKEKLKSLMTLTGIKQVEASENFGMVPQSFNRKMNACETAFTAVDLARLGELTGTQVAFIDKESGHPVVVLSVDDFQEDITEVKPLNSRTKKDSAK